MNTRLGRLFPRHGSAAALALGFSTLVAAAALPAPVIQQFFVPMPETQLQTSLRAIDTTGTPVGNDLKVTIALVTGTTNTVLAYDQWEDGYENDLNNPIQASTQIWGDGNTGNGVAPGYPTDLLPAGAVIILTNTVTLPRNPAVVKYDGRDRIGSTKPVVMTRAGWGVVPGTVLTSASAIYDISRWGTDFELPVGTNVNAAIQNFSYSAAYIMASENGTVVQIDRDGNGTIDQTSSLNMGDNLVVPNVTSGATITATKPVQVHELTGRIGSTYQSRTFAIRPKNQWDTSYHAAAGTTLAAEVHNVFVFNPYATNLPVRYETATGTGVFLVTPNATYKFPMPLNSGGHFYTTNGAPFYAVAGNDSGAAATANQTHDWGYALQPDAALTTVAVCGWCPGSDDQSAPAGPDANGSPVWVTPLNITVIYVNYSGNPTNGPLTAPNGVKYNISYSVNALQFVRIFDPNDKDMTGARIFTADGTRFTSVWGEDSATAGPANPYLDMGLSVLPFPTPSITKVSRLAVDVNANGLANVGDTLEYTIRVQNQSLLPIADVLVADPLPANLAYVLGTTTLNGSPVADNFVPPAATKFPLDEAGIVLPAIPVNSAVDLVFRATISAAGTITNYAGGSTPDNLWTNSVSVTDPVPPGGAPTCSLSFSDSGGNSVGTYAPGAGLYVNLTDSSLNTSSSSAQSVVVLVQNPASGDQEFITLVETGLSTGVFRNASALASSTTLGVAQQDGTLYALSGQALTVNFVNPLFGNSCSANATIATAISVKKLYLSDPSQALDRIDPVATSDPTTANTAVLNPAGSSSSTTNTYTTAGTQTWTVPAGVTSITVASWGGGGAGGGSTSAGTGVARGGAGGGGGAYAASTLSVTPGQILSITVAATAAGASGAAGNNGNPSFIGPDATPANAYVRAAGGSGGAGNTAGTTPAGGAGGTVVASVGTTRVAGTTGGNGATGLGISSGAGGAGAQGGGSGGAAIGTQGTTSAGNPGTAPGGAGSGARTSQDSGSQTGGQGASGRVVITYDTPLTQSVAFSQLPSFCTPFSLPSGGTIAVTNYVSNITGTMTASPNVTAVLRYGTTTFATLTSPSYSGGILGWSGTLSSNVTIPAGQAVTLWVTNNEAAVSFRIDYDSSTKPSAISLPTTTIINVDALGLYAAPYPSATVASSAVNGQTLYVRAAVSDPFGSYDVNRLVLTITDPSAGVSTITLTNAQVVADNGCVKTYEIPWLTGVLQGNYQILATAHEGTEGITATRSTSIYVANQDLGTPSTTQFTFGNNGYPTNSYTAGASICIRVIDLDQNTDPATVETVTAVVTVSTGDRETITLTETGVNTGIFTACPPSNTGTVTTNNGTLNVVNGAALNVTYTDPNDPSDVSSDDATIKPASAGTPSVSIFKTVVDPANGLALVGSTVQFDIQVANSGTVALPTVTLIDTNLNTQFTFVGASVLPSSTNSVGTASSFVWNNLGPLAVGASTNVSVFFKVLTTGNLTNGASISGTATSGSSRAGVTGIQTGLAIAKVIVTPVPGPASISNTVVFRIGLTNTGTTTITNLPLEDSYSAGALQYVGSSVTPAGAGGGQILWANLGPLAAGANTSVFVTNIAVGVSSPTINNAAVNYGTDANGNAVPPVQTSTNLNIVGASLGTNVWFDANGNGLYDAGDTPLAGAIVFLDANNDGLRQPTEIFDTADINGHYLISSLAAGTYTVRVDTNSLPAGVRPTYDLDGTNTANVVTSVTLTSGQNRTDLNFGYTGSGSIGDRVWYDVNGDGLQQGGEPGLAGIRVFMDANGNGAWDAGETYQFTTATGAYAFSNLVAGTYSTAVDATTLPAGAAATGDLDGLGTLNAATVVLAAGQTRTDADFGYRGNSTIGDFVWTDTNGNGIQDSGETGLAGVTITLYDTSLVALESTVSVGGGAYSFTNLLAGSYIVGFGLPGGYAYTTPNAGSDTGLDSNASVSTGRSGTIVLTSGQTNNSVDAGYYQPASLSGRVLVDVNGNGTQDGGETTGIGTVTITLQTNGVTVATTQTDSNGNYSFTNLPPGNYTIVETDLGGYQSTGDTQGANDNQIAVTLSSGQNSTGNNFLDAQPVTVGNFVWEDVNNNGLVDAGENGFNGVTVELWRDLNNDGMLDRLGADAQTPLTTVTSGGGIYGFSGPLPGQFFVRIPTPPPFHALSSTHTTPTDNGVNNDDNGIQAGGPGTETISPPIVMSSGETDNTVDFGFTDPGIGNLVWVDINRNGRVDAGEPGVSNVVVELYDASNVLVNSTTTDQNGYYLFQALAPNSYYVKLPASNFAPGGALTNYPRATSAVNADNQVDDDSNGLQASIGAGVSSPLIALAAAAEPVDSGTETGRGNTLDNGADADADMTVDFGFTGALIGDFAWLDVNKNGIQDDGEPGLGGVTVVLYSVVGGVDTAIASTNTAADGSYQFGNLPPGDYQLQFNAPTGGYTRSPANQGVPAKDSDASATTGRTVTFTLTAGATDLTRDAGFEPNATAAAQVWLGAYADHGDVWVTWQTASESGLIGFDVWRRTVGGAEVLLTTEPVIASGAAMGQRYLLFDLTAPLPGQHTYRLVGYRDDGTTAEMAQVTVRLEAGAAAAVVRITGLERSADGLRVEWSGGQPPYVLEQARDAAGVGGWQPVGPVLPGDTSMLLPLEEASGFFRVRSETK